MRKQIIYGFLVSFTLALCISLTPSANAASTDDEVLQVMNNWFKAFNANDYNLMSSLHWNSPKLSKFGPSKSETFLVQGDSILSNWKLAFADPVGTYANSLHHPQVTMLDDNVAVVTLYNSQTITDPATKKQTVGLYRGTFIVQKINGKWLIVHEHASVVPNE